MLILKPTKRFIKDLKRLSKSGKNIDKLENILDLIQQEEVLPLKNKLHKLTGNWTGHYECHIEPDWLLIYRIENDYLVLERTGSHSDLFG